MSNSDEGISQPDSRGAIAVFRTKRQLMTYNFLGGIAWGFGTVMGATIIVAIGLYLFNILGGLPVIGEFISDLQQSIESAQDIQ